MDHHRTMRGVVLARVREVKPFGRVVIELDRAQLPVPANRVGDGKVDLGPVEGAVPRHHLVGAPRRVECGLERRFGPVPQVVGADAQFRAGRELQLRGEPEGVVVAEDEVHQELHLVGNLVFAQVDMAVVLRKLPHAREPRQRPGQFVPVQHVERHVPHREFPVRVLRRSEVEVVRRTVHRLQRHVVFVGLVVEHEEHVLAVLPPVARLLPQLLGVEERRLDLEVRLALPLADELLQRVVQHGAAGGPEGGAGRHREELEKVERATDHPMVAPLGFLHPVQVGVELFLLEEGGGVDALQHLPLLVAAPVGAGGVQQLEVLEVRRVRDVRPPAEVDERPVGVGRDDLVGPLEVGESLELQRIVAKNGVCLFLCNFSAHERQLLGGHLLHLGLERLQVLGREGLVDLEVVIEPVVDGRAEADLRLGAQPADRGGEDVRPRMTQHGKRARVLVGDDRERAAPAQRRHEVLHLAVDRDGDGRQQQARANGPHDVLGKRTRRDFAHGAIGERKGQQCRHAKRIPGGRVQDLVFGERLQERRYAIGEPEEAHQGSDQQDEEHRPRREDPHPGAAGRGGRRNRHAKGEISGKEGAAWRTYQLSRMDGGEDRRQTADGRR